MKLAVTGGAGFIGSYLVKKLVKQDHDVLVIDNLYRGKIENLSSIKEKIDFRKIDIRNFEKLRTALKDVDGVFHEAALTDVQESFSKREEYHDVNVIGTENVFRIAKEFCLKVVYASSSSVYGNPKSIPIREDAERNPINPYGITKVDDEFLAERYTDDGISVIGLRYFNVYGEGQTGSYAGVITKFVRRLKEKKSPLIFGAGEQIRDFIFVEDIADANIAAMQSSVKNGFFNIGTGITTSINELSHILIELSGLELKPEYLESLEGDVQASQADTKFTEETLKWKYKTELKDGLKIFFV